jgi:hypothetical protein
MLTPNPILDALLAAGAAVALDWHLGIILAVSNDTFSLQALPRQLATMVFPYLGGLGIAAALWFLSTLFPGVVNGVGDGGFALAVAAFAAKIVQDILQKLTALFSGKPNPNQPSSLPRGAATTRP